MSPRDSDHQLDFRTSDSGYICIHLRLPSFLSSTLPTQAVIMRQYLEQEVIFEITVTSYCDHCLSLRLNLDLAARNTISILVSVSLS